MLVPDLRVSSPGLRGLPTGADRAASTSTPGATQSGFRRPSRVGPTLLNGATARMGEWPSYAPTTNGWWPLAMVPVVVGLIHVVGHEPRLTRSAGLVALQPRVEPAVDDVDGLQSEVPHSRRRGRREEQVRRGCRRCSGHCAGGRAARRRHSRRRCRTRRRGAPTATGCPAGDSSLTASSSAPEYQTSSSFGVRSAGSVMNVSDLRSPGSTRPLA